MADALSKDCSSGSAPYIAAIWSWDAPAQTWHGFFPDVTAPGANDLTTLMTGSAYLVSLVQPASGGLRSSSAYSITIVNRSSGPELVVVFQPTP